MGRLSLPNAVQEVRKKSGLLYDSILLHRCMVERRGEKVTQYFSTSLILHHAQRRSSPLNCKPSILHMTGSEIHLELYRLISIKDFSR